MTLVPKPVVIGHRVLTELVGTGLAGTFALCSRSAFILRETAFLVFLPASAAAGIVPGYLHVSATPYEEDHTIFGE
jgi:hypothetical protein